MSWMCMAGGWRGAGLGARNDGKAKLFGVAGVFIQVMPRKAARNKPYFPMKTIPLSMILAGFLAPSAVHAQAEGRDRRKMEPNDEARRAHQQQFAQAWKAADKDADGFISREEFAEMARVQNLPEDKRQRLFDRLDKDGDGKLGREELRGMGRPQDGPRPAMQRLWELDVDGSGGVSLEEFKAGELFRKLTPERQLEIFKRLDTDGDDVITPKDRPDPRFKRDEGGPRQRRGPGPDKQTPQPKEPRALIRELDQDNDGALSFEEFRAGPAVRNLPEDEQEDRFEALDRDGDHKITPADLAPRGPHGGPRPGERQQAPAR